MTANPTPTPRGGLATECKHPGWCQPEAEQPPAAATPTALEEQSAPQESPAAHDPDTCLHPGQCPPMPHPPQEPDD
ncbi:hypothetical protein [Streptacidiphilus melanogenes]|uniref:hypothetical protein n=1 Tax=Streptacidiphilus melanogenes TaxID=411235 RepID=UPI0005AAD0EF|nr:hypothetical protein [Streptacidiphilus melanogenes]